MIILVILGLRRILACSATTLTRGDVFWELAWSRPEPKRSKLKLIHSQGRHLICFDYRLIKKKWQILLKGQQLALLTVEMRRGNFRFFFKT